MIKVTEKKPATHSTNPDIGLEVKNNVFISVPYIPGLGEDLESFDIPVYMSS